MKHVAVITCIIALLVSLYSQYRAYQVREQAALLRVGVSCTRA